MHLMKLIASSWVLKKALSPSRESTNNMKVEKNIYSW